MSLDRCHFVHFGNSTQFAEMADLFTQDSLVGLG